MEYYIIVLADDVLPSGQLNVEVCVFLRTLRRLSSLLTLFSHKLERWLHTQFVCISYECVRERERERCYNIYLHKWCVEVYNISDVCGNVIYNRKRWRCAMKINYWNRVDNLKSSCFWYFVPSLWIPRARCWPKYTLI